MALPGDLMAMMWILILLTVVILIILIWLGLSHRKLADKYDALLSREPDPYGAPAAEVPHREPGGFDQT